MPTAQSRAGRGWVRRLSLFVSGGAHLRQAGSTIVNSQLLYILVLAMVAGVILFRLYTVLGRRTGNERPPQERFERIGGAADQPKAPDNVVLLPDRNARPEQPDQAADPVARGLLDIKLADRTFDTEIGRAS